MRMPRSLISMLLAVSVLAGQFLAAAHNSDHGLAPNAAHSCAICLYAHGAGAGALPVTPTLSLAFTDAAPEAAAAAEVFTAPARRHPIRGPPQIL
jgi:hypothetical protein